MADEKMQDVSAENQEDERSKKKFVWPWVGLVANLPTQIDQSGRRVGQSGSHLRDELILKGFNPFRVQPIWDYRGHSGFALVEFNKDFEGFENAMQFERWYESEHHGKKDWQNGVRDGRVYGWVAREDDYNSGGVVGKNVRKKRDLKSVSQIQDEDERKLQQLVTNMAKTIDKKIECRKELEEKVTESSRLLEDLALHNHLLNKTHEEVAERMHMNVQAQYQVILEAHEKSMLELEKKRQMLEERARRIDKNEAELERSRREREMNQKAMWEQTEANEEAMKLAEKHKKEKEKLHQRIIEMETKLNAKQELELEIEELKGKTSVMKHMVGNEEDAEFVENMAKVQRDLEARETALHEKMMALSQKERVTNYEFQDARKAMIQLWNENEETMGKETIRVKRMGQLNPEPFLPAVRRKLKVTNERAELKAMELCSVWEGHIGDVHWNPFRVDESDGTPKRVVDKNDEKLFRLKKEYGVEVYNEVVRAKMEIEDSNASGGYVTLELWNYKENRKATMEEAVEVMIKIRNKLLGGNKNKKQRF